VRASLALGAAVFALYASGACPTIYVGDSGELVTAVARLGIPHPTGYPLYVLAGKLWTLAVPVGSIAWRMSLFSALAAAAAVAGVHDRAAARPARNPVLRAVRRHHRVQARCPLPRPPRARARRLSALRTLEPPARRR